MSQQALPEPYKLPSLEYDFGDLEPAISAEIMNLHYSKHHQTYVNNLNKALEQYAEASQKQDLPTMESLLTAIKFNGAVILTILFFGPISPPKTKRAVKPHQER